MSEYTPGPWNFDGRFIFAPDVTYADGQQRTTIIADVIRHKLGLADRRPPELQRLRNARLIAAAPDLLEALQMVCAAKKCGYTMEAMWYECGQTIQAAIAKAEEISLEDD